MAPQLTLGGPPECPKRPLCLAGLEQRYGLRFKDFLALDAGGPLTLQALRGGHVDVGVLFTTDPSLAGGDLVALSDNRGLQPAENVTPLVRTELVQRWGPHLVQVVDGVSRKLATEGLRQLNARMASGGTTARAVAAAWLSEQGLGVRAGRR